MRMLGLLNGPRKVILLDDHGDGPLDGLWSGELPLNASPGMDTYPRTLNGFQDTPDGWKADSRERRL